MVDPGPAFITQVLDAIADFTSRHAGEHIAAGTRSDVRAQAGYFVAR